MNARRYFPLLLGLLIGLGFAYTRRRALRPCARPIQYSIGSIDPRFQMSGDVAIHDANAAAAVWNHAAGRELFTYRPSAPLSLNLVYDTRQENVELAAALDTEDAEHQAARKALDDLQRRVMDEGASYNADVQAVAARGGANPDELHALQSRRLAIDSLSDSLHRAVAAFNEANAALKSKVDRFNESAGKTFAAGRFIRDSVGERIEVFRFATDSELMRLLAHEFGHALGLDHNDDSTSIMYMMDERGNLTPSAADLRSLRQLCGM